MSSPAVTAGALAISLAITGTNLWTWWKSPGREPKLLIPFGGSYVLGGIATICGGLLGILAGWSVGAGNAIGKHAVSGTTGQSAAALHHGSAGHLTPGGGIVTFLLTVAFVIGWKASEKLIKRRMFGGFVSGATMTFTVGMAGLFLHVVAMVNGIGDPIYMWFDRGVS